MMQSTGTPQSPIQNPQSEIRDPLSPFFFSGFFRLLYWTFFKPSAYNDYIHSILGDAADRVGWRHFWHGIGQPRMIRLAFECLFLIVAMTLIVSIATGLLDPDRLDISRVLRGAAGGVALGVAVGVAWGVTGGVALGVAWGVSFGVAAGVILAVGMALGVAAGVAGGVAFGVALGVAAGVAFGVALGVVGGVVAGVAGGVTWGVAVGAGVLRLPFYLIQLIASLTLRTSDPATALRRSPAMWDDLMVLPLPHLVGILRAALHTDLTDGLRACGRIVSNPFQRWAAQRALRGWLSDNPDQVFHAVRYLFEQPEPYRTPGFGSSRERRRMQRTDYTTRLILGELARRSPIFGVSDRLARAFTSWLRDRRPSPLTALATAYYELLENRTWDSDHLAAFEHFTPYRHGEETYQTFRTLDNFLDRTSFANLSDADSETTWTPEMESPLRPATLEAISKLAEVSRFVRAYRSLTTDVGRRDALTNASIRADAVRKMAEEIKSPERVLIAHVAQQWFDIITAEQSIVAAPREVRHIRNMYLVGRPVMPDSGHPFVGRRDQFETIERMWADAALKEPVILHGQRRMGKSSILHHLEKNLGPAYVALYANLQSLAAVDTTGALVYNLCDEIHRRLRKASVETPAPQPGDFAESFTGLRRFLNEVEDRLGDGRWLVLMLDEFEMIEDKIKDGAIRPDLLYQFRDAMLNRPRLAIVLAGVHTLDEMTRDYWSPFFSGSRNVKVSYLDPDAAEVLITNPWDGFELEFERDAVRLVADVTGCQPTLLQAVCSALIDRVNARLEKEGAQYSPRVAPDDVKAVLNEVQASSTYFDAVWKELDDNERLVLAALAEAQTHWNVPASCAEVEHRLQSHLSPDETDRAWDLLKKRDMIILDGRQAKFYVELVRRWVKSHKRLPELLKPRQE